MGKEGEPGFVESASKKLALLEAGGAAVLYAIGSMGWAGILAVAAGFDFAIGKVAEKWRKRGGQPSHA